MAPSKRKAGAGGAEAAQKDRRNRQRRAALSMQSFLQQLRQQLGEGQQQEENDQEEDPSFVQALALCHERFLHVLAAELVAGHSQSRGVQRIGASHVEAAMRELGMEDLLQQAQLLIQQGIDKNTSSRRSRNTSSHKSKKKRQFTDAEIAEQERLLASSKDKLGNG